MSVDINDIENYINNDFPLAKIVKINSDNLVFEELTKLNCFYCPRYGTNWKCPPNIPKIDYKKIVSEFENAAFVYNILSFDEKTYSDVRTESSVLLHKTMLHIEKYLFLQGYSTSVSFIGGSCKLCKNGCGKDRCNNPGLARIPLEATGVNVVKSAEKYGIKITFPVTTSLIRIGLILW